MKNLLGILILPFALLLIIAMLIILQIKGVFYGIYRS